MVIASRREGMERHRRAGSHRPTWVLVLAAILRAAHHRPTASHLTAEALVYNLATELPEVEVEDGEEVGLPVPEGTAVDPRSRAGTATRRWRRVRRGGARSALRT